jgi:hypothetical protein
MDLGTTALLDLPEDFKKADMSKHPGIDATKLVTFMMTSPFGQEHRPELQAVADEGARCALDAMRCGGRAEYERIHPELATRLREDIAFNKGFESVMWSAAQHDGEERVAKIKATLAERDARGSAPSPVRG